MVTFSHLCSSLMRGQCALARLSPAFLTSLLPLLLLNLLPLMCVCVPIQYVCVHVLSDFLYFTLKILNLFIEEKNTNFTTVWTIFPCVGRHEQNLPTFLKMSDFLNHFKKTVSMKERIKSLKYVILSQVTCLHSSMIFRLIKALQKSELFLNSAGKWDIQYTQGVSLNMYAKNITKLNRI